MAKPDWINVSPQSGTGGGEVEVQATENSVSVSSRSGSIVVETASGLTKTVSLSQEGAQARYFNGDGTDCYFYNRLAQSMSYTSIFLQLVVTTQNDPQDYGEYITWNFLQVGGGPLSPNANVGMGSTIPVYHPVGYKYIIGYGFVHSGLNPQWEDFKVRSTSSSSQPYLYINGSNTYALFAPNSAISTSISDLSPTKCTLFNNVAELPATGDITASIRATGNNILFEYISN